MVKYPWEAVVAIMFKTERFRIKGYRAERFRAKGLNGKSYV